MSLTNDDGSVSGLRLAFWMTISSANSFFLSFGIVRHDNAEIALACVALFCAFFTAVTAITLNLVERDRG